MTMMMRRRSERRQFDNPATPLCDIMLQHKESTPEIEKIDAALSKGHMSPEKKRIVRSTLIRFHKALEILSQ